MVVSHSAHRLLRLRSSLPAFIGVLLLLLALSLVACGGNAAFGGPPSTITTVTPTSGPAVEHVVVVVEENHSYSQVIGNSSMPYLNGLASSYSLATNYYADIHPSLPNYFMLTTGSTVALLDSYPGPYNGPNIASVLTAAGKSWKVYAENLPQVGYTGGDAYPYVKHHNPFAYFSSVLNDPAQQQNIVPFSQFQSDLSAGTLPSYSFVVPNLLNDAHDGSLAQADGWLQTNIGPLVKNSVFANTLLIIVFDESIISDLEHGGGHVAAVLAGGMVKRGFQSSVLYQHESVLRESLDSLKVGTLPGAAAGAPLMSDFFQ
jgi:phospholipase C